MRDLRKLCGAFGILPSSFALPPELVEHEPAPFAWGGFSDVYKATFKERDVAVKILRVDTGNIEHMHKVGV